MRRGLWVLVAALAACGLFSGCGTILGIEDFTPGADGGGKSGMDSGGGDSGSGGDARRGDSGGGKDGGAGRKDDSGSDGDADLDGEADSESDDGTADAGSDVDANEGGCPTSAPGFGKGGTLNWADQFGVTGETNTLSLALDPTSGDVVIVGYLTSTTNFGEGVVAAGDAGQDGGFVARFDSTGTSKWALVFPGLTPGKVAVDGTGNVLIDGSFSGTVNFGGGHIETATDFGDNFLAKFDPAGNFLWVNHYGEAPSACCTAFGSVVADASGNVYLLGEPGGNTLSFGAGCDSMPATSSEFVAKFDSTGTCVWGHSYGARDASDFTLGERLTVDSTGDVLVAGGFYGTIDFGSGSPKTAPGTGMDAFVQKLSPSGAVTWAKSFGTGASIAQATGVGTDGCGNIWIDGTFTSALNFGCGKLSESGLTNLGDIFLAKLDPGGNCLQSYSYGDSDAQSGGALAVDGLGGPAITGEFSGTVNFGGSALSGGIADQDTTATYIAKFDSAGVYDWAYAGGLPTSTATNSAGFGIAANSAVVVGTGVFSNGTLVLAGDALTAVSIQDTYLASFAR